ncbi:hypothetical protein HPB49_001786 [Dermacentor silvarum]|uniref:Uncharacterized protein n=1 Tax=Dermacentor silvarum TaxID=543639 RepID=A0ACB8C0Z6_DERSI|nr:hypothetical protein HPB49_001786 [Dermacentor silvarum]
MCASMAFSNQLPDVTARPGPSRMTDTRRQDIDNMDFQEKKPLRKRRRPTQWNIRGPLSTNKRSQNLNANQPTGGYPPLPKDDFKIVVRPHQGLPVKNLTSPLLAAAVIAACSGKYQPGSNIFMMSTPHRTAVDRLRHITTLNMNDRPHSISAYVATSDATTKGVIDGLDPHTTPEALKANRRIRKQVVA